MHDDIIYSVLDELSKEYGNTFNMRLLWDDMIVTIDHDVIKFILATGFNSFGKGPKQQARLEGLLGDGIFNRDGDLWKFVPPKHDPAILCPRTDQRIRSF
ncbi:cytochrome P450 domain-containing protein [Rhizoctonia solani AG-1 IA]|uniref:Cytochrome P450 domain-containing protein n=1 Tax=Thanatephorus cucumeris (strain AG1-IA) TaxID=983506 RepID=L8X7T4_THACA|nr:cytochrome P450 domain-containing protein [Rhizoctonia solani AG-1 IA]